MKDSEIVAAIAAGKPAGLPAAYDKYAYGVYGYCHWMLREPAYAADALLETFVVAVTELGGLEDAIAARAVLYAAARAECHRQLTTAGAAADRTSAAPAGFRNPEHEAGELSIRHGLSEAELAAVLDIPWQQAHSLAARARDHLVPPSMAFVDRVPPQLREQALRRAAVSAAAGPGDVAVSQAGSTSLAGLQWLGKLLVWRTIRANAGAAMTTAAIAAWVTAAVTATLITFTGTHPVRPPATQTHERRTAATGSAARPRVPPGTVARPLPSAGPSPTPASRSVPPITTRPSPT